MNEDQILDSVAGMAQGLADLFDREAGAENNTTPESQVRYATYKACAEACVKASCRKIVMTAPMEFNIVFRIPNEAR